jgi:signal transduction histidine kinase
MRTQLTIFKKCLALIAVPLVVQAVFIAVLVKNQADHVRAQNLVVHTKDVIVKVEDLHRSLVEGYAGARGLVFPVAAATVARYQAALAQVPVQIGELRELVADNARQKPRMAELTARSEAFLRWVADEERLVRSGARDQATVELGRGAGLLDELRTTIDSIRGEEEMLDRLRMDRLQASSSRQVWTIAGGGAAIVVSTLILAVLFLQGIIHRLAVLRDNARRFGEGKPLNSALPGRDEITEVDHAFHDMAANLSQQNQENDMFVYSVSHDLRSPLVNLQGFSEEISLSCRDLRELFQRDDVPEPVRRRGMQLLDRDIEESIRFIQAAVGRLARIIDALLRLSRAGRVEYQWKEVDLAATVGRIVDALHDTITARKAQVAVGALPPVWGDPTALEQVFANLIGNAVQYLDPDRPGRIEIDCAEPEGAGVGRGLRVYRVRDNGLGIPEAYHQRMFTAFSRFHPGVAPGEGIGLALVRRMVERHGGRIWLESLQGAGTTFFLALPPALRDGSAAGTIGNGPHSPTFAAGPSSGPADPQPRGDRHP